MELDEQQRARLTRYVCDLFAPEDDVLRMLIADARQSGLPDIQISGDVGRFLQILVRAIGARRILEVGTLGGYSGIWMARGLPPDGKLVTLEIEPRHAEFARRQFARAGLGDRVEVRLGPALETLPRLASEQPFDFAFIDADKEAYPAYLDAVLRLLRPGALLTADNVLHSPSWQSPITDPEGTDPRMLGIREFNLRLASHPRLVSVITPVREGVAVALVLPD